MPAEAVYQIRSSEGLEKNKASDETEARVTVRVLVVYIYYETYLDLENLSFFLKNGVVFDDEHHVPHLRHSAVRYEVEYLFIIHGQVCSLPFPRDPRIHVCRTENRLDLASFFLLFDRQPSHPKPVDPFTYDYIAFLNSSCRGPFLAPSHGRRTWFEIFIHRLLDTDAHMVAPIMQIHEGVQFDNIHHPPSPFCHSYMFMLDRIAVNVLDHHFFQGQIPILKSHIDPSNKAYGCRLEFLLSLTLAVHNIRMTSLLIRNHNVDFLDRANWRVISRPPCPEIPGNYDGIDVHPLEVIFFKNNRRLHQERMLEHSGISKSSADTIDRYTKWMNEKSTAIRFCTI